MYEPNFHNFPREYISINTNRNLPKILSQSSLSNTQNNIISNLPNIQNLDIVNQQINPLTSPDEGVTVFTSPYLSAGAPALGEAKGLIQLMEKY